MSRKRDKPYPSRQAPTSFSKRRRPLPPPPEEAIPYDAPTAKPSPPPALVVSGLHPSCSVLDLKSRFEIYGQISRIRIDRNGVGYITYRSRDSGEAAVAASLDPSFGITVDSKKVTVLWATDPLAQWREGVAMGVNKNGSPTSSKLLRAEPPLSRRGRGNKLASTVVNPRSSSNIDATSSRPRLSSRLESVPFKGREIVAYDDIL